MIYKRYLNVTLLIIVCFISSFISLFEGLCAIIEAYNDSEDMYLYGYKNNINMDIISAYEFSPNDLCDFGKQIDSCNVFLENMYLYFDGNDNVFFNPVILLAQNEKLPVPTDKEITYIPNNYVIVPLSYGVDSDDLSIHGKPIKIYTWIDDCKHYSSEMKYTMNAMTYFSCYSDGFNGNSFSIRVSSNEYDPYNQCVEIERKLREVSSDFYVEYRESNYERNIFSYANDDSILISNLLYLFSVMNSTIVTFYWVTVRKKEISIRKAFGAKNITIWKIMLFELFAIIGAAGLCAYVIGGIVQFVTNQWMGLRDYLCIGIGYLGLIIFASIMSLIIPLKKIIDMEPKEGVSE